MNVVPTPPGRLRDGSRRNAEPREHPRLKPPPYRQHANQRQCVAHVQPFSNSRSSSRRTLSRARCRTASGNGAEPASRHSPTVTRKPSTTAAQPGQRWQCSAMAWHAVLSSSPSKYAEIFARIALQLAGAFIRPSADDGVLGLHSAVGLNVRRVGSDSARTQPWYETHDTTRIHAFPSRSGMSCAISMASGTAPSTCTVSLMTVLGTPYT